MSVAIKGLAEAGPGIDITISERNQEATLCLQE